MKNKRPSDNSGRKEEDDEEKEEKEEKNEFANSKVSTSITDLWQQYSPSVWTEMYSEFLKYTTRMSEIYHEYAKSSEIMTALYKELAANAEKMRVIQGICEGYRSNDQILATLLWDQVSQKNNEEQEEKK